MLARDREVIFNKLKSLQKRLAILAIWSRVAEKGSFKCACAIDPDLSKLDKLNGKSFVDYAVSFCAGFENCSFNFSHQI